MICSICGAEFDEKELRCPVCGTEYEYEPEPEPAAVRRTVKRQQHWQYRPACLAMTALATVCWLVSLAAVNALNLIFVLAAVMTAVLLVKKKRFHSGLSAAAWSVLAVGEFLQGIVGGLTIGEALIILLVILTVVLYWALIELQAAHRPVCGVALLFCLALLMVIETVRTVRAFSSVWLFLHYLGFLLIRLCFLLWGICEEKKLIRSVWEALKSGAISDRLDVAFIKLERKIRRMKKSAVAKKAETEPAAEPEAETAPAEHVPVVRADRSELDAAISAIEELEFLQGGPASENEAPEEEQNTESVPAEEPGLENP